MNTASQSASAGLLLQGVSKQHRRRLVLDDVSVELKPGTTALEGSNGSGKSTVA